MRLILSLICVVMISASTLAVLYDVDGVLGTAEAPDLPAATAGAADQDRSAYVPWVSFSKPLAEPSPEPSRQGNDSTFAGLLQRELRRVGCYSGAIDGDWTPDTRKAMSAFLQRIGVKLPSEAPDSVLLTLVQGHRATVCAPACGPGQVASTDNTCVAKAVTAQKARRPAKSGEPGQSGSESSVTVLQPASQKSPLPAVASTTPATAPAPNVTVTNAEINVHAPAVAPLEGRMTVGAAADAADAAAAAGGAPAAGSVAGSDIVTSSTSGSPRPVHKPQPSRARRDTAWTGGFFHD